MSSSDKLLEHCSAFTKVHNKSLKIYNACLYMYACLLTTYVHLFVHSLLHFGFVFESSVSECMCDCARIANSIFHQHTTSQTRCRHRRLHCISRAHVCTFTNHLRLEFKIVSIPSRSYSSLLTILII